MKIKLTQIKNTEPKREHGNIEGLKQSIEDVGLVQPIVINQDFELLAGRRRYQAVSELGWDEVECHVLNTNLNNVIILNLTTIENKCEICSYPFADRHHVLPKKYGGTDAANNFIYLCANHHRAIHFLIQLDLAMGKKSEMPQNGLAIQAYLILNDQLVYRFYQDFLRGKLIDEARRTKNP